MTESPSTTDERLADLAGQLDFFRRQVNHQFGQLGRLAEQHGQELSRFRSATAQRAMAGVFHRLFAELLEHMNQLDALCTDLPTESEWGQALVVARASYEQLLARWGCAPVPAAPGDIFDPEMHEAVDADRDFPEPHTPDAIVYVQRRGWRMQDSIIQFPRVVVG